MHEKHRPQMWLQPQARGWAALRALERVPSMVRLLESVGAWPWLSASAQLAKNKSPFVPFFCRQLIKRMLAERLQPY